MNRRDFLRAVGAVTLGSIFGSPPTTTEAQMVTRALEDAQRAAQRWLAEQHRIEGAVCDLHERWWTKIGADLAREMKRGALIEIELNDYNYEARLHLGHLIQGATDGIIT